MRPGLSSCANGTYGGAENPGKRGPKPHFSGSRRRLLEEHLEDYAALKFKNRNQFWFKFFGKWWERYPWKLDDKEEPPLDDPVKMSELASVQEGELSEKSDVEGALTAVSFLLSTGTDVILPTCASASRPGLLTTPRTG